MTRASWTTAPPWFRIVLPWAAVLILSVLLYRDAIGDAKRDVLQEAATTEATRQRDSLAALLPGLEDHAVRLTAEASAVRARLDSVRTTALRRSESAKSQERVAEARALEAGATTDATLGNLRAEASGALVAVADSLGAQVAAERAAMRSVGDALRAQIEAASDLLGATTTTLEAETRRADALQAYANGLSVTLEAQARESEAWKVRALSAENPGVLTKIRRAVVPLAIGVIGGVLLK